MSRYLKKHFLTSLFPAGALTNVSTFLPASLLFLLSSFPIALSFFLPSFPPFLLPSFSLPFLPSFFLPSFCLISSCVWLVNLDTFSLSPLSFLLWKLSLIQKTHKWYDTQLTEFQRDNWRVQEWLAVKLILAAGIRNQSSDAQNSQKLPFLISL